ncbi:formate/nitrite transporter family protein [Alkaliphilus hydrothermalis]|uniref:Nitrite transporter NirC n=1 Tax=Alkaliphilus hydrothermalis TaxID=1482730 RepID=A0ABS2NL96_9FIRM|nr:formate/nitrite transporter family protein [Alkaliphilus hydrothermalis]MBM7613607.1 nitrite transporter NirC [Alkaliphilus hydrothermalis]
MYQETVQKIASAAKSKVELLNNSFSRFFILSMMAGVFVGFGVMLVFSIAAPFKAVGSPVVKALMGASFGIALTLIIFAGSELFTGNNMIMTIGSLSKEVTWRDTARVWIVSYLGNLVGSLLMALLLVQTGLVTMSPMKEFLLEATASKMNAPVMELFFRGIFCNMLVCLAIWMVTKAKEDTAKLILIFWCLFGFIGAGFEHSIANMSLLGMGLLIPHDPATISWAGYVRNLGPVTVGNMVGGALFIGAMYWYVASDKMKRGKDHGVQTSK